MLKRSFRPITVLLYATACLGIVYLLFRPEVFDSVLSKPLYGYSILLLVGSSVLVLIIAYRNTFFLPSLFLLIFFVAGPLLGPANFRRYLETHADFFGRGMPSFDFPTFVWSVGTICFFGGVFLAWLLLPRLSRSYVVLWDRKRLLLFLKLSLFLAIVGTLIGIYRIGYVPLFTPRAAEMRLAYGDMVGPFAARFSGEFWVLPNLLASTLFFLENGKRRYMYLGVTVICALGTLVYAGRTGVVLVLFAFGLLYVKSSKARLSRILVPAALTVPIVYGLMMLGEYRGGMDLSRWTPMERIRADTLSEWKEYSVIVDETRTSSDYSGWRTFVGPFFTLIPGPIFTLLGSSKSDLITRYSAVFHYGREFDVPMGMRIGPIGEGFAAYGFGGVFLQMVVLGVFFGLFEKRYVGLEKDDARLCVICYFLSLMLFLPITTMLTLLAPLLNTGVFVFLYHILGTRRYPALVVT
jgi:oligosaccharide repeat unit polymerase